MKFYPHRNLPEKPDPKDRHSLHLSQTNENLCPKTASNPRKATPDGLFAILNSKFVQGSAQRILSQQRAKLRIKSRKNTRYFTSSAGKVRVLIIWRRIVRFTVTRVHERARAMASHSPIVPPNLFRECIATPIYVA